MASFELLSNSFNRIIWIPEPTRALELGQLTDTRQFDFTHFSQRKQICLSTLKVITQTTCKYILLYTVYIAVLLVVVRMIGIVTTDAVVPAVNTVFGVRVAYLSTVAIVVSSIATFIPSPVF